LVKLLLTAFAAAVLLQKMELINYASRLATADDFALCRSSRGGVQLVAHAAGGLLVLLAPVVLSIYSRQARLAMGGKSSLSRTRRRSPQTLMVTTRADVRFARPNIQIYDAHVVDLYQWVCARYLVGVKGAEAKAKRSSALD
jgi:hypothetical protein